MLPVQQEPPVRQVTLVRQVQPEPLDPLVLPVILDLLVRKVTLVLMVQLGLLVRQA